MLGPGEATYESFATTHEDRLVRSLVSETGLSPACAAAVAADVLRAAYDRSFASCGAAYGWLRVAARHHVAGSDRWAAAADAALDQADVALTALAGLTAADRELLRLRYVDGLLPEALAARLATTVDDVLARLDRVRVATAAATAGGAACTTAAPAATAAPTAPATPVAAARATLAERVAIPLPRAAAALAAAAVAVMIGGGSAPRPATVPPRASAPWGTAPEVATPGATPAADQEQLPASERAHRTIAVRAAARVPVRTVPDDKGTPGGPGGCVSGCSSAYADEIHVDLPEPVGDQVGRRDVVIKQEVGGEEVSFCEIVQPVPREVARCVPGRT